MRELIETRVSEAIMYKLEVHANSIIRSISTTKINPMDPFKAEHVQGLRDIAFDTFAELNVRHQLVAGKQIDDMSMELLKKFIGHEHSENLERSIVFIPGTTILLLLNRSSYDLVESIKASAAVASEEQLRALGDVAIGLHDYMNALKGIQDVLRAQVSQGRLSFEEIKEYDALLKPFGPLSMNAQHISSVATSYRRSKQKFIETFDNEQGYLVLALSVVFAEQNGEAIKEQLERVQKLPIRIAEQIQIAEQQQLLRLSDRPRAEIKYNPIAKKAVLETVALPTVHYNPAKERENIAMYLRDKFEVSPKYRATCHTSKKVREFIDSQKRLTVFFCHQDHLNSIQMNKFGLI